MSIRIIAHIDMDAFFAAVEQRDNPSLKGKPVVIGADPKGGKGRGVVSTCSYEARRYGIHSAQPISIAYQKCPQAIFLRGNHSKYSRVSKEIRGIFYDFTPDVEPVSIDEAFLDVTGCWRAYGSPVSLAQKLKDRIKKELGLTASVGIAPVKFVAKIASDFSKPDGLLEILPEKIQDFLFPLPVEKLWGVGEKSRQALNHRGIMTVGDLARLDRVALVEEFGQHGGHLYDLAHGIDPRPVAMDEEVKSVSHEHTFDVDEKNPEEVLRILLHLTEKVSRRLRKLGLKGKTVSVKVRTQGFKTHTRDCTLPHRVDLIDEIFPVAKQLFEDFYRPVYDIRLIGVRVSNFDDPYVEDNLFTAQDEGHQRLDRAQKAMEQIKDKFGDHSIHRGF